jgi:flagellin
MSVINTNLKALVAQESMRSSDLKLSAAMERLSTGSKINSAKDDAAGLAISNRMTSQIRGMAKAIQNTNDAISMTQTAEGAYKNIGDILQRMRELSVQASTGTMNDSDRASMQLEVSQLKAQIEDIAVKTNHNNIKLLDGSAQNVVIQTGTNAGDTIKLDFGSARTKDIGVGTRATLASAGGQYVAGSDFEALGDSDLFLNGVSVGASLAVDDKASNANAATSAIAKAAAINKVSAQSGVYAKAGPNVVSGQGSMAAASTSGTIVINGVATDSFATSSASTSLSRQTVVNAINNKSAQTGVRAIDTESDDLGVTLVADDGRNIDLVFTGDLTNTSTGVRAAAVGAAANNVYVGSYDLFTLDGRDINVSFKTGSTTAEAYSGLRNGTYAADTALMTSYKRDTLAAGTAPDDTNVGTLQGNSMIINGVAIGPALLTDDAASDTTATSSSRLTSAISIAAAINRKTELTGVSASAAPNVLRGMSFTSNNASQQVFLNGVTISASAGETRNGMIDAFNAVADRTGVTASAWGDGIELRAADGRNISIGTDGSAASLGLGSLTVGSTADAAGAVTYYSQVTLQSDNKFEVQAGSHGIPNLELLGFRAGTYGGADNGLKINQVDISTVSGAQQGIVAIDAAIETISKAQANSGALNNRMDYILNNLAEASQNMSASRSRILDTDYASETQNLAKQQIISQAATAMLAQANQQPQTVLSLLK